MKPSLQRISNAFKHMPNVGCREATTSMSLQWSMLQSALLMPKVLHPHAGRSRVCPDVGSSVKRDGAALPCTKVESLSLMQLLILLTIRRTSWKSEPAFICPKVGSVPLQEELTKCNFGGYWDVCRELAYSSGVPGWKWGDNWWICHWLLPVFPLSQSFLALWPSPDVSRLTHWASDPDNELLHHVPPPSGWSSPRKPLVQPKTCPHCTMGAWRPSDTSEEAELQQSALLPVFSLLWLRVSSFRLPLWFIVLLHFWAPGKCFCPINFNLEVSMFPGRKINHSSWEGAPHTTSSLVWVPPLLPSTFFSLLLFPSPSSEREGG